MVESSQGHRQSHPDPFDIELSSTHLNLLKHILLDLWGYIYLVDGYLLGTFDLLG